MASKSPLQIVKERFTDKKGLVAAVTGLATEDLWVNRVNSDKTLANVSNAKLLRLHSVLSAVKEKFGTRAKLIEAVLELESRPKDLGRKARLEKFPVPRLFDMYRSGSKRKAAAEKKADKAKKG